MTLNLFLEVTLVAIVTLSPVIVAVLTRGAHAKRIEAAFHKRGF